MTRRGRDVARPERGRLRIIAGTLKGRRIAAPTVGAVRPTGEKVREALFDILGGRVEGARVLDAFAGSGALGCEALSRGAREVVFVESDPRVAHVLRANLDSLGVQDRSGVLVVDATSESPAIESLSPFDLVLADPPYGTDMAARFLDRASASRLVRPRTWLVLEVAARDAPLGSQPGIEWIRSATYGDSRLEFFEAS